MSKNLVIVESPAKAKTISKYLGKDFDVMASYGHVRDLPSKDGAVDPDNDFAMTYELNEGSEKHVRAIVSAARKAEAVYLATDLDREGEAISWHVYEILREKGLAEKIPFYRIEFSEITKKAIQEPVDNPRELSMDLVNAQQARRALDHLVGFNLSPLLWRKIKTGLSAGRVQSPALRMIVEREREIEAFDAQEYWTIEADLKHDGQAFDSRLVRWENERLKQFDISNAEQAQQVRDRLLTDAGGRLKVGEVSPEGVRLISADSNAAILEVDGARKEYALGNTVSTQFTERTERKERLHRDPSSGMYFARGRINAQPVKFMVDTGATSIAMSTSQAKQLGIRYELIGSPTKVRTASGNADAYSVNLRTVSVGEISQSNIEALVVEGKPDGPILLGMSFLGRLGVEQTRTVMTLIQK